MPDTDETALTAEHEAAAGLDDELGAGRRQGNDLGGLSEPLPRALEGRRVMVAEDNVILSMHVASLLEDAGAEVFGPYPFAEEALNRLGREPLPDVAVLDYELMGGTSRPIADRLDAMGVPFAFFTSYEAGEVEGRVVGVPVLPKPNEARALLDTVANLLVDRPAS